MRIVLERFGFGLDSTLGRLYVPGLASPIYTLEDEVRAHKVDGETAIWEGTYPLELRAEGGMHPDYLDRFPDMHMGMIWVRSVAEFKWIYIHVLNREDQTEGCIGVGERPRIDSHGEFSIVSSEVAYRRVYPVVANAIQAEDCDIRVTRRTEGVAA